VLRARDDVITKNGGLPTRERANLCASFQAAVSDVLSKKSRRALAVAQAKNPSVKTLAVAGGVAANQTIRTALK